MSDQPKSFFDSKTIFAIGLTMVVWIGWQSYLNKKYPNASKSNPVPSSESLPTAGSALAPPSSPTSVETTPSLDVSAGPETLIDVDNETWAFQISSQGMGLRGIRLKQFTNRDGQLIHLGGEIHGHLPLETNLTGRQAPLSFVMEKVSDTHFIGRARAQGLEITKTLIFDPIKYRVDAQIAVKGQSDTFLGLTNYLVDPVVITDKGSFLAPAVERQEVYVLSDETHERHYLTPGEDHSLTLNRARVVALGSHYFTQALVDRSNVLPEVKTQISAKDKTILTMVNYAQINRGADMAVQYSAFLGPKDLNILKSVDSNLAGIVDFGFFSFLGRPILKMLKWFHGVVGNWGIAIILLTILVRFLVLPFNVMSFRSMKAMQLIQPQLQALREKFKNDPNRLNQETLLLFRTHKVNPLGGCLPVLLQIPIFFALYQVLGQSVELYQAPFMLWIHDLSHKDPYFVLPILMGITMFLQQKLTPTTMDPAQAKILMFMPLIFSIFMLALPSGLTLYIFVSTLFGIGQQLYLMKGQILNPVTANK